MKLISKSRTSAILCLLMFLLLKCMAQKAILMSSSLGYYNIRQVNNIVKIYNHFISNGFSNEDIILMISEVQTCCQKNHKFGTLSFYDGDYTNIFKNIQIDYYQSEMTAESVAQIIMGYHTNQTLNKRKLDLKNGETLFIYITGHGGDTYFKIRQRQALITQQFAAIFRTLKLKNPKSKFVIVSDSCSAITPFQTVSIPNFLALGSSSQAQKSLSHGYDVGLNQPKTDDFSYYFDQILNQKASMKGLTNLHGWTFKDLHKYMDHTKLKVNSKLITNRFNKNQKLTTFIRKKQPSIQFIEINNNKKISIQRFFNS